MDQLNYHQPQAVRNNFQAAAFVDPRLNSFNNALNNSTYQPRQNFFELQEIQSQADQQYIEAWLIEKGKINCINPVLTEPARNKSKNEISINGAKKSLKNCILVMEKLHNAQEELRSNVERMTSIEWKQKTIDIGLLKDEFNKLMVKFDDSTTLKALKRLIEKRQKKRRNQRNSKLLKRQLVVVKNEKRQKMHKNIDEWLESKKLETEKAKLEEKLKKDADCILYEVTKNKSDARKHLSLISALVKLRTVRESMAVQRGEKTSAEDRQAFGSVTEKLIRMWENSFQQYSQEEQKLKATLEDNAVADSKAVQFAKDQALTEEWKNCLFGVKDDQILNNPVYWALTSAERDMETFIAIRKSWDTFLVDVDHKTGTCIPIGWVTPPAEANDNWNKYMRR